MKYYFFSFCIIVFQKKYKEKKLKNKLQKNKDKNKKNSINKLFRVINT
jgi:hypothetical protein